MKINPNSYIALQVNDKILPFIIPVTIKEVTETHFDKEYVYRVIEPTLSHLSMKDIGKALRQNSVQSIAYSSEIKVENEHYKPTRQERDKNARILREKLRTQLEVQRFKEFGISKNNL